MTRYDWHAPFDVGSVEATIRYNAAIADLAAKHGCILADVWAAEGLADWLIHPDGVHANAVGSLLIAHRVFEAIAQNCSGLSNHTRALDADTEWTRHVTEHH
jgi:lysophospholipase L1-like esterase